jgi:hypothetical protein
MVKNKIFIIIILFFSVGCKTNSLFSSNSEKRQILNKIKDTFNLDNENYSLIQKEDSIIFEINESLIKKVNYKTTKRRIDSFLIGKYDKKKILIALNFDQLKNGWEFDFDYSDQFKGRRLNFKSINEYRKFNMDSLIEKELGIKKRDTMLKPKSKKSSR